LLLTPVLTCRKPKPVPESVRAGANVKPETDPSADRFILLSAPPTPPGRSPTKLVGKYV
jgi:hypothetical protein